MELPAVAEDPYGSADPAPLPAGARLVPNVGSAISLHNGPVVEQLRWWNNSQGIDKQSPAGNTGDRMPPVTPTPGVSESPLPVGILPGPSLAWGLSSPPQRPVPYPPT